MSRLFYHVMQDNVGNLLFDVSGTMRIAGSGTLATIYGDEALTIILANPMTNHPSFGSFKCFLGAGDYDFYMAKSGYTFETLTGVQGHGTMAQQDANAVAITGGSIILPASGPSGGVSITDAGSQDRAGLRSAVQAGTNKWNLYMDGSAPNLLVGRVGFLASPRGDAQVTASYAKATTWGLALQPVDLDTGSSGPILFVNVAGTPVGSITSTASATAYNTTSDARLKRDIAPLTGALDVVRALRPVSFLWKADGSPGRGFLAHEVQQMVPEAVAGAAGAVREDGRIDPQGVDFSKLVPWLVAAVKELTEQVEMLTAQLAAAHA